MLIIVNYSSQSFSPNPKPCYKLSVDQEGIDFCKGFKRTHLWGGPEAWVTRGCLELRGEGFCGPRGLTPVRQLGYKAADGGRARAVPWGSQDLWLRAADRCQVLLLAGDAGWAGLGLRCQPGPHHLTSIECLGGEGLWQLHITQTVRQCCPEGTERSNGGHRCADIFQTHAVVKSTGLGFRRTRGKVPDSPLCSSRQTQFSPGKLSLHTCKMGMKPAVPSEKSSP